ncbi:MAG: M23 family metallopeptidase [Myxococcota bacterium]
MRSALAIAVASALASPASAAFRRPFDPYVAVTAGYDDDGVDTGCWPGCCTDYTCGGNCYDGHSGTDFDLNIGNSVLAAASGTVAAASQGCPDWGYYCSPCGSYCGNQVRISHSDGSSTLYCHLKDGSLTVSVGQSVSCGEKIAESASSGCSTGDHLHFGWRPGGTAAPFWGYRDPYSGGCSNGGGAWVDQGGYGGSPGTSCGGGGGGGGGCSGCTPGAGQSEGCGNCGTRSRSCGGDCQWGGWGGCGGEGSCAPGAAESVPCCDCGASVRTCGGDCQWGGWGACGGPDPPDAPPCPTGLLGDCATGRIRCVAGCLACAQTVAPSEELCDARDNDCDGPADEGATVMGDPPPPYAADLEDWSAPTALRGGEDALVWATFRNVGTAPWPADAAWLRALALDGTPSALRDPAGWAAYDVAAGISETVEPGETTTVSFAVRMPDDAVDAATRFVVAVEGTEVTCPEPGFEVAPAALVPGIGRADGGSHADGGASASGAIVGGCALSPHAPHAPHLPAMVLAAAIALRRRRSRHLAVKG